MTGRVWERNYSKTTLFSSVFDGFSCSFSHLLTNFPGVLELLALFSEGEELSFALGKEGATRRKLASASGPKPQRFQGVSQLSWPLPGHF